MRLDQLTKFDKFLVAIKIISQRDVIDNNYTQKEFRVNPYNPLSYIIYLTGFIIAIGVHYTSGLPLNAINPFKWRRYV